MDSALDAAAHIYVQNVHSLGTQLSTRDMITRDTAGLFCADSWKELATVGLTGLPVPRRYGGQEATAATTVAALTVLGETCTDNGLMFALGAHLWACTDPIVHFGTEAQKERWLPGLCDGSLIGAHAATETEAGSDAAAIRTTAVRAGHEWVLNGAKTFVTNGPVADLFLVTAVTNADYSWLGISLFLVPSSTPGVHVGPVIDKSGLRTALMSEVTFDDCRIDADALLGSEGSGMSMFTATMTRERAFITAPLVGVLRRLAEQSASYAATRRQFGTPIAEFQAVAHRIAEMRLRAETAAALSEKVAHLADHRRLTPHHAAMMKLHTSEAFVSTARDAIQIHGGYGYTTFAELERMARDAMGAVLYSGTSDIQRNLIARAPISGKGVKHA